MELTKKSLLKHCREMNLYSTPELNDKLYLHQKGIDRIQNLDEYVGVRVLWLQSNAIQTIENLNGLIELRHLYLSENLIEALNGKESMKGLSNLDTLNLEKNHLSKLEEDDLSHLSSLSTLNLSFNQLSSTQSLFGLLSCPSLCVLDLRNNGIRINNELIDGILSKLPNLRVLYLISAQNKANENTLSDELVNYRKRIISQCQKLRHLDDRPVFDDERRCISAWASGGVEAEKIERKQIKKEKEETQKRNHAIFAKIVKKAKTENNEENDDDSKETIIKSGKSA